MTTVAILVWVNVVANNLGGTPNQWVGSANLPGCGGIVGVTVQNDTQQCSQGSCPLHILIDCINNNESGCDPPQLGGVAGSSCLTQAPAGQFQWSGTVTGPAFNCCDNCTVTIFVQEAPT